MPELLVDFVISLVGFGAAEGLAEMSKVVFASTLSEPSSRAGLVERGTT